MVVQKAWLSQEFYSCGQVKVWGETHVVVCLQFLNKDIAKHTIELAKLYRVFGLSGWAVTET